VGPCVVKRHGGRLCLLRLEAVGGPCVVKRHGGRLCLLRLETVGGPCIVKRHGGALCPLRLGQVMGLCLLKRVFRLGDILDDGRVLGFRCLVEILSGAASLRVREGGARGLGRRAALSGSLKSGCPGAE